MHFPTRELAASQPGRTSIELTSVVELPDEWFGYDAVDVLVISVGDGELCKSWRRTKAKFAALERWVELGGRLVILCGGDDAREDAGRGRAVGVAGAGQIGGSRALAGHGRAGAFRGVDRRQWPDAAILVPRLADVTGRSKRTRAGSRRDLPLVVRAPRGFGEVAFVGRRLQRAAARHWPGRTAFLQRCCGPTVASPRRRERRNGW